MRKIRIGLLAALTTMTLLPALGAQAGPELDTRPDDKISPEVTSQLEAGFTARYIVLLKQKADLSDALALRGRDTRRIAIVDVLKTTAAASQGAIIDLLTEEQKNGGVASFRPFWVINGIGVESNEGVLRAIASRREVASIETDGKRELIPSSEAETQAAIDAAEAEWNIEKVGAPLAWQSGIDGSGAVVANIDTGVDWEHVAVSSKYRGADGIHDYNWRDSVNGQTVPYDDNSHGTHTMGTMVGGDGSGPAGDDIGVAPGAGWIAAKAFSGGGYGYDTWILDAAEFLTAPTKTDGTEARPDLAPDVVSNSWGGSGCQTFFEDVLSTWRAMDIFPAFSIGNSGEYGTGYPGDSTQTFSVGATDINDEIAYFSSRGPSCHDEIKPEVSAPGVAVRSSIPGGGYASYSGTSMASPHVGGTIALMVQASSGVLGVDQAETAIAETTLDLGEPGPDNSYGSGRLRSYDAMLQVLGGGNLEGNVIDTESLPVAAAKVTATGGGRSFRVFTQPDGTYKLRLAAGQYTIDVTAFGYSPASASAEVTEDTVLNLNFTLTLLPTATISGHVQELPSGADMSQATITVVGTPLAPATTDASGNYSLLTPIGTYTLVAQKGFCRTIENANVEVASDLIQNFGLHRMLDSYGYSCDEAAFVDEPGTKKVSIAPVVGKTKLTFPFPFDFYGETFNEAWVYTNGYVSFSNHSTYLYVNRPIPDTLEPNGAIYAMWDLLMGRGAERGLYTATYGDSPNRRFVIEFRQFERYETGDLVTFSIVLHENGEVEYRYGNLQGKGNGTSATVGIESPDGLAGFQYSHNQLSLNDFTTVRWDFSAVGFFSGTVTSAADGLPISGATVKAGGSTAITKEDGTYQLAGFPATYGVTAEFAGYQAVTSSGTLIEGETTQLDFALPAPRAILEPSSVTFTSTGNDGPQSATLSLTNSGQAGLSYVVKEAETSDLPVVLEDPADDGVPWRPVDVIQLAGISDAENLTVQLDFNYDTIMSELGGYLFLDIDQNPETGVEPVTLSGLPTQEVGVEYYFDFYSLGYSDYVVIYDQNGYFLDSVIATKDLDEMTVRFSAPLDLFDAYGAEDGQMNVAGWLGRFYLDAPPDFLPEVGAGTIFTSIDHPWLSLSPAGGDLGPGQSGPVVVTVDGTGLRPGVYTARVLIQSNDPRNPKVYSLVTLNVLESEDDGPLGPIPPEIPAPPPPQPPL